MRFRLWPRAVRRGRTMAFRIAAIGVVRITRVVSGHLGDLTREATTVSEHDRRSG